MFSLMQEFRELERRRGKERTKDATTPAGLKQDSSDGSEHQGQGSGTKEQRKEREQERSETVASS